MKREKIATKRKNPELTVIRRLIELIVLILLFIVLDLLRHSQAVCEFFARTFSRAWILVFGNILGWIPISFYEIFLIVAILGAIAFVVFTIVFLAKRKWQAFITSVLVVAISVISFVNIYTATASFAYGRDPLPNEVYTEYSGDDLTFDEAVELANVLIEQMNAAYAATEHDEKGNIVYPYNLQEMSDVLAQEYSRLDSGYFSTYTPRGKYILNKNIMSELHITGVFFAPFGEANINGYETHLYLPHTLAHEMAHGKGVMREYEANLTASYVLLTSDNPYLRYGALVKHAWDALNIVGQYPNSKEAYSELYKKIDDGIWTEKSNYSDVYSGFDAFDRLGDFFNDLYLKLNKQEQGTGSYNKPGQSAGTGEVDNDGFEIVQIISFSGDQNLLIKLYKENLL